MSSGIHSELSSIISDDGRSAHAFDPGERLFA